MKIKKENENLDEIIDIENHLIEEKKFIELTQKVSLTGVFLFRIMESS